ncbi:hypothetical protein Tco_0198019, partial [Tanacetum coccineum]
YRDPILPLGATFQKKFISQNPWSRPLQPLDEPFAARRSTLPPGAALCRPAQHSAARHNTLPPGAALSRPAQHSAARRSSF